MPLDQVSKHITQKFICFDSRKRKLELYIKRIREYNALENDIKFLVDCLRVARSI